jgi:hypothetical protein
MPHVIVKLWPGRFRPPCASWGRGDGNSLAVGQFAVSLVTGCLSASGWPVKARTLRQIQLTTETASDPRLGSRPARRQPPCFTRIS